MNVNSITQQWARSKKINFKYYPSIGSTNTECKRLAFSSDDPFFLCFADHQTGGRGRFDRQWMDHGAGSYLLSSWSYKVSDPVHPLVTARLGLQVANALAEAFKIGQLSLKAPNDIYIGSKKVAGLLTETISQGNKHRLIVGLGLNVLASPSEQLHATSLKNEKVLISEPSWNLFLDLLEQKFLTVAESSSRDLLDANDRSEILKHLNALPLLTEKYLNISNDGYLETSQGKQSWLDL